MPKLTIDGRPIEVPEGETLIRAARRLGIPIPHFCWHPELSVAANCRMCLVEIEKQPKLQPACQIPAAEGMVVSTTSPRTREAQRAVMEYLLLNHPVDCPICDQSGECKLQDYYMAHDLRGCRLWSEEHKVAKRKRAVFGPHVIYDAERCVMCTRCVRFCDEVVRDPVLIESRRGDHSEIALAPGRTLDHAYSLMTAHVCPVGALTSRRFRFQKRVWFLSAAPVICPGCATGCNAFLDHERGVAYRLRPRENPEINKTWLCDDGVLAHGLHNDRRLRAPALGRGEDPAAAAWPEALEAAAKALGEAGPDRSAVLLSAEHSCEDNLAVILFARQALGITRFALAGRPDGAADTILRSADKNPNRRGATLVLGAEPMDPAALADAVMAGEVRAVLALGGEFPVAAGAALPRLDTLVTLAARGGPLVENAHVRLPVPGFTEDAGTWVNEAGLPQRTDAALPRPAMTLPVADVLLRLARRLEKTLSFASAEDLAAEAARRLPAPPEGGTR